MMADKLKILVKLPSKGRAFQLLNTLNGYFEKSTSKDFVHYIISCDSGDGGMEALDISAAPKQVDFIFGTSKSKVESYNRNIPSSGWDILCLASDDFICIQDGWDDIIRNDMIANFPDGDGVLFYNDGYLGRKLNTMPIMGNKYYSRFGYAYHPSYVSFWCDNETTEIADLLGKQVYFDRVLFKHEHPINNNQIPNDDTYRSNDKPEYYKQDMENFERRKAINFGLKM